RSIWCSNLYARQLMDIGFLPPYTGKIAFNPWAEFNISGQFICESFGLIAPAMPQTAARIGLHYTHVTIEGEPAQTTQLFTSMIATAFTTDDLETILDAGVQALDPNSVIAQIAEDVRRWHREYPDNWTETRRLVKEKYSKFNGEMRDSNGYELNTASTIAALLYGEGDFVKTLITAFNFGWDADNNAATSATIIGIIRGWNWMESQGWNIKDLYRNTTRDNMPASETITGFGDRLISLAEKVILEQGGNKIEEQNQVIYQIKREEPQSLVTLPDLAQEFQEYQTDAQQRITQAILGDAEQESKARAAYEAIALDLAPELMENHPQQWQQALAVLKQYPQLLRVMFESATPDAEKLRRKARAVGLERN
ncbi:MAG: ADP-ribosylglycohydrolase family protein, partial [bacterium]